MGKIGFSMEIFPPKVDAGIEAIYAPLADLSKLSPDYISVTFSAGGSAVGLTDDVCAYIQNEYNIPAVAHLTCAGSSKEFINNYLDNLQNKKITRILALRGDLAEDKTLSDYVYATDLIKDAVNHGGFDIFAACYPEGYKESPSFEHDIEVMKLKEDAGATHFISQLFFDEKDFLKMRDQARKIGVKSEISAGIMPVTNARQIVRMVQLSGARIPKKLAKLIARYEHDPAGLVDAGIEYAVQLSLRLASEGVDALHLYAMNNADVANKYYRGIASVL